MVRLYCEGKSGCLDFEILNRVIKDIPDILIQPIGGKGGSSAIIDFYENKGGTAAKSDFYLMFRDRDFDCAIPVSEELSHNSKNIYFSYRTTIENYLFDVNVFFDFISQEKITIPSITSLSDVKMFFIDCAQYIKDYQIVRHALGAIRNKINLETTWTSGSGDLPVRLDSKSCKEQAIILITKEAGKTTPWTTEFQKEIQNFNSKFDIHFFNSLEFLVWFQGKDFAKVITTKISNFPMKKYYRFALEKFGDYTKTPSHSNFLFDDLRELRDIIKNKRHK